MAERFGTLRASLDVALGPAAALALILEELGDPLARRGVDLRPDGVRLRGGESVAHLESHEPGRSVVFDWRPASWDPDASVRLRFVAEPFGDGSRVTVELDGLGALLGGDAQLTGWFASELAAPLLARLTPGPLGDWITDRGARRPSGSDSRAIYRDPLFHYPNFKVILAELALTPADTLLEVACGGGALLRMALVSGCRAAAVDHSPDMVRLAREENRAAIAEGRLEIREASADALPFPDGVFTCAAMTGVLGFLPDPVAALREIRRVLAPGGRIVVMGTDPENRGTPAAPEPYASRLSYHELDDLERMGREAGFGSVRAVRREMAAYAREVGVPEPALPLFDGPGARFLLARKE